MGWAARDRDPGNNIFAKHHQTDGEHSSNEYDLDLDCHDPGAAFR